MNRRLLAPLGLVLLSACVETAPPAPIAARPLPQAAGLDRVMGKDAATLQALFGPPDLDVREDKARKLQYAGAACVLDAYLYPPARGGEPIVTYVDTRLPNGDDVDRASCIAALSRRSEAR